MNDVHGLSTVILPRGLEPGDLTGLIDQLAANAHAVVKPDSKSKKKNAEAVALPDAVAAVDALPAHIAASLARLENARDAMRAGEQDRATAVDTTPEETRTAANAASDDAWRSVERWLGGWRFVDDDESPGGAEAGVLYDKVFSPKEGLRFIGWRPRKQWEAMTQRMPTLEKEENVAVIQALGGARILAVLKSTHAAFGRAFGFTKAAAVTEQGTTDLRPQWLAAQDTLRDYVRKVSAHADPDIEGSEAFASYLLAPYRALLEEFAQRPAAKPTKKPVVTDGGTPTK